MSYDIIAADGADAACLHDTEAKPVALCFDASRYTSYRERVRRVARVIQAVMNTENLPKDAMDTDMGGTVKIVSRKARFRGRNSASQTVVVEAIFNVRCQGGDDWKGLNIPVKTIFKWYRQNDKEVLVEAESYSCVVDKFVTPFFAFPLCVAFPGKTPENFGMEGRARRIFEVTDEERLGFIVSENCGAMTLARYVNDTSRHRPFDREFYSAIVQVCLALDEMAENGVVHHDMHFGNIMFPESRDIVQNVGTNTKTYLVARRQFLDSGATTAGVPDVWVVEKDGDLVSHGTIPSEEDAFFAIDRMVKIYDWDWIETRVSAQDKKLYHDKIGFLRNLVSLNFPMRAVLGSDGDLEKLDLVLKKTEYKRLVRGTLVTYAQKSEMNALRDKEVEDMKKLIDTTFARLASYAFLACLYYDLKPFDESEVFGEGPMPDDPEKVFEKLRSASSASASRR